MLYQLNIKANTFIEPVIQVKKNVVIRKPTIKNKVLQEAVTEEIENSKNNLFKTYKDASFYAEGSVYETENYESVFLIIETYVGGAHPCHDIKTWVIPKEGSSFLTLDDLINKNDNFLKDVSQSIRGDLLLSPKITNATWLMEGTRPLKENYENFVLEENKIIFIFKEYQIAPYASGIIKASYDYSWKE